MGQTLKFGGWALMTLLCLLLVVTTLRYFGGDPATFFQPEVYMDRMVVLRSHIVGGILAALAGPPQFLPVIRRRFRAVHRALGKIYILAVLVSAVLGLVVATTALGGFVSQTGFSALAIGWATTTLIAYRYIRTRNVVAHRRWMIRSFALTFAFVMLRLILPSLQAAGLDEVRAFQITAWACWVPNVLIVEFALRHKTRTSN